MTNDDKLDEQRETVERLDNMVTDLDEVMDAPLQAGSESKLGRAQTLIEEVRNDEQAALEELENA